VVARQGIAMEEGVGFQIGDISLEGLISGPPGTAGIGAVVCHPHPLYGGDMHNNVVTALVQGFQRAGMATLRFNFRGVGASGGQHDDGRAEAEDVAGAVTALLERCAVSTMVVAGYSFGSMVGLRAGAADPRVHKLIGVALPIARRDASFLATVSKPKLLISGDRDDISPAVALQDLFATLPEPKELALIRGADHFFAGREHPVVDAAVKFATA
jgi:uncharacterized protein